jgi:hypothetical protein
MGQLEIWYGNSDLPILKRHFQTLLEQEEAS